MVLGAATAYERGRRCRNGLDLRSRRNAGVAGAGPTTLDGFSHRARSARPSAKLLRAPGTAEEGPAMD